MLKGFLILSAIAAGLILVPGSRAGTFQIIGPGLSFQPSALSADDQTLVGTITALSGTGTQAAYWTQPTGLTYLANPDSDVENIADAVSADGSVIVGFGANASNVVTGWRWTASGGYQLISTPGFDNNAAQSVSADGATLGVQAYDTNYVSGQAYLGNASGDLTPLPSTTNGNTPVSINLTPDGKTAIGFTTENRNGYIWTSSGGSQDIPTVAGTTMDNTPEAVTPDGSIVFGNVFAQASSDTPGEIFRYSNGVTTLLGQPDPTAQSDLNSNIGGTTANGQMLVGSEVVLDTTFPIQQYYYCWVWTPAGGFEPVQNLLAADGINIGDYAIVNISGISADGNILYGYGSQAGPDGSIDSGWIAYLPEPNALILLLPLAASIFPRRRHGHLAGA